MGTVPVSGLLVVFRARVTGCANISILREFRRWNSAICYRCHSLLITEISSGRIPYISGIIASRIRKTGESGLYTGLF